MIVFPLFPFQMPKIQFRSKARPSLYAYPAPLEGEKKKERAKVSSSPCSRSLVPCYFRSKSGWNRDNPLYDIGIYKTLILNEIYFINQQCLTL